MDPVSLTTISIVFISVISIFLGIILWSVKYYSNKKFNNHRHWENIAHLKISLVTNLFKQNVLPLDKGENILAMVDFEFYPLPPVSWEEYYMKIFYLTNKQIILARFSFSGRKMKCRYIPFSEIENSKILRIFAFPYLKLSLKSGEIYQIGLNKRIFSRERVADYNKIMNFLQSRFSG